MILTVIDSFQEFVLIKNEWADLLKRSDCDNFYLTHEWLSVWWNNLSEKKSLKILIVKQNDQLIAAVPLVSTSGTLMRLPVNKLEFMGAGWGHGGIILTTSQKECIEAIFDYINDNFKENIIVLSQLINSKENMQLILDHLKNSKFKFIVEDVQVPYISMEGDWDGYLNSRGHGSKRKRNIKRRSRMLSDKGELTFERHNKNIDINDLMNSILLICGNSWKAKEGTAISSNKSVTSLYKDLLNVLSENNWIDVAIAKVNSLPIVYMIGVVYNKTYTAVDIAFDDSYAYGSPGILLHYYILEYLFKEEVEEFDFVMAQDYKKEFTSTYKDLKSIYIFKKGLYPLLLHFLKSKIFQHFLRAKKLAPKIFKKVS